MFLNWIFSRAHRVDDTIPTIDLSLIEASRPVAPLPAEDPPSIVDAGRPDQDEALENLFCHIEYEDAAGNMTRRPVTFLSLSRKHAAPAIIAVCHMRKAMRAFRVDRIRAIITADGEVFDGHQFLTDVMHLRVGPAPAAPIRRKTHQPVRAAFNIRGKPGTEPDFRQIIRAPMTVLVACGKADGHFHREEVDRIMSWSEIEALHLHRIGRINSFPTIAEFDALGKSIAMMRPQARTLQRHMLATLAKEPDMIDRFRRALLKVVDADGVIHAREVTLVESFDSLIELNNSDPNALLDAICLAAGGSD